METLRGIYQKNFKKSLHRLTEKEKKNMNYTQDFDMGFESIKLSTFKQFCWSKHHLGAFNHQILTDIFLYCIYDSLVI